MNVGIAGETPFDCAQGKPALRNQVRTATTTAKAPSRGWPLRRQTPRQKRRRPASRLRATAARLADNHAAHKERGKGVPYKFKGNDKSKGARLDGESAPPLGLAGRLLRRQLQNCRTAGWEPFDCAQGKSALQRQRRTATTTAKAPSFPTDCVGTQNARKLAATKPTADCDTNCEGARFAAANEWAAPLGLADRRRGILRPTKGVGLRMTIISGWKRDPSAGRQRPSQGDVGRCHPRVCKYKP